jgi:A/G-specific adenine glycosylase
MNSNPVASRENIPRKSPRFPSRRLVGARPDYLLETFSQPAQKPTSCIVEFFETVIDYYKKNGRHDLPWRKTSDLYKILVSEMMLQQTQVLRVIPKYEAFLKWFPNVETLAQAELGEVYELWQGLGYNRRARFLRDAARVVVQGQTSYTRSDLVNFVDLFPDTIEGLERLPGVGPYTARAVYTFTYNKPCIVIETNVRACVLHHFFPKAKKGSVSDARIEKIMDECMEYIESRQPKTDAKKYVRPWREWYSALMDYGTHLKATQVNPSRKSRTHVVQKKFKGSVREVRGEILRILSQARQQTRLAAIRKQTADSLQATDDKFDAALSGLIKDGMVVQKGVWVELGK